MASANLNPSLSNELKFTPEGSCYNRLLGMGACISGLPVEHARQMAEGISNLYNNLDDPDFVMWINKWYGLPKELALTLGDLGLLVHLDINVKEKTAIVVQGLTTPACHHGPELLNAGKMAVQEFFSTYVDTFESDQRQRHNGILPPNVSIDIAWLRSALSSLRVNTITQYDLHTMVLEKHSWPQLATKWHEGWITPRGLEKLEAVEKALTGRSSSEDPTAQVAKRMRRNLYVNRQLQERIRKIPGSEYFSVGDVFRAKMLAPLPLDALEQRDQWDRENNPKATRASLCSVASLSESSPLVM